MVEMAQRVRDRFEPAGVAGREFAAADGVDGALQPRRAPDHVGGIQPLLAPHHHVHRLHAEDRDVFGADMVADLDVGAVERADGQRAVHHELHVAGAGRFLAGGGNLLRQIGAGTDYFHRGNPVIR